MKARWLTVLGVMIVAATVAMAASEKAVTKEAAPTPAAAPAKEANPSLAAGQDGEMGDPAKETPEADPFFGLEDLMTAVVTCNHCSGQVLACDAENVFACCDAAEPNRCGCRQTKVHPPRYDCCQNVFCG